MVLGGASILSDHIGNVSSHYMRVWFTADGVVDRLELDESDLAFGVEAVARQLHDAFGEEPWRIEDADGVPTLFVDGEPQADWTLDELCRFARKVDDITDQDCREAFLVYVSKVGVEWSDDKFDEVYQGAWLSVKQFTEHHVDDVYVDMCRVPSFVRDAIDWDAAWSTLNRESGLYAVKLSSGRYAVMQDD